MEFTISHPVREAYSRSLTNSSQSASVSSQLEHKVTQHHFLPGTLIAPATFSSGEVRMAKAAVTKL